VPLDVRVRVLHEEIGSRAGAIAAARGAWPCRRGCDARCRLAEPPRLAGAEWAWLARGLAGLPAAARSAIAERVAALPSAGPVACPFLDTQAGICLVYEHRPAACRAYGFYVARGRGWYCPEIAAMQERGECAGVVWGNAAALEARLDGLGERVARRDFFARAATPQPCRTSPPARACGSPSGG
jgi:uncharacterized protein